MRATIISAGRRTLGLWVMLLSSTLGCSSESEGEKNPNDPFPPALPSTPPGGSTAPSGTTPTTGTPSTPNTPNPPPQPPNIIDIPPSTPSTCGTLTCSEIGWACGYLTDECGELIDCADEGLACASGEVCIGGIDGPTECVAAGGGSCELCSFIPNCDEEPQPTRLSGRVVTPGRSDEDRGNQVGVPNALVYILQTNDEALPEIPVGVPSGGTSCDRCEDQEAQLGPVLFGAVTDATGAFTIEQYVPVGREFTLVVKAGKFRRAVRYTLPEEAACQTTQLPSALPDNPVRLPRDMSDGDFVNIPRIAISTGQIDAMECVFEKMGLAHAEFGNPGVDGDTTPRVHLYRGGSSNSPAGAYVDEETPHDASLYGELERLQNYDMVVADCEGPSWDGNSSQRGQWGAHVREYVNRGGRMFASHLSFSWLNGNGEQPYDPEEPLETGLGLAAEWSGSINSSSDRGTGIVALDREHSSPRVADFAAWLESEGVVAPPDHSFNIIEPRSQVQSLGEHSEEFIHCEDSNGSGDCTGSAARTQQFSFNTPYGAPAEAACGRVAYSGFHVAASESGGGGLSGPFGSAVFPSHCSGDLTDQEKVLLYMLFDLGACVGDPPPPPECNPSSCEELGAQCGHAPDGCGGILDCGACVHEPPR